MAERNSNTADSDTCIDRPHGSGGGRKRRWSKKVEEVDEVDL